MNDLGRLFSARSVALVGATERSNFSNTIMKNLQNGGYDGALHLVHPKHERQFDLPCVPSLTDIAGAVDVAYLLTGPSSFAPILADCGAKGIPWAVILSGGFKEMGGDGHEREAQIAETAREHGVHVLGPNALGFVSCPDRLSMFGNPLAAPFISGGLGLVSHTGGMSTVVHRLALQRGIGMSRLIALGNCAMVSAPDVIDYLVDDPETRVIAALIETLDPADAFVAAARRALEAEKPVVLVKFGRAERTTEIAVAHTGQLAGADRVVDGVLRQLGAIRVDTIEELVETGGLIARKGCPAGRRVLFVSGSGGASALVSDLAARSGVELPEIPEAIRPRLAEVTEGYAAPLNPLDMTGFLGRPEIYRATHELLGADPSFDAYVTMIDAPVDPTPGADRRLPMCLAVDEGLRAVGAYGIFAGPTVSEVKGAGLELAQHGMHFANGLPLALLSLGHAGRYAESRQRALASRSGAITLEEPPLPGTSRSTFTELETLELLDRAGIPTVARELATTREEAAAAAERLGYPVVLKVQSPDVPHKSDAGGVVLGVGSGAQAAGAYDAILTAVTRHVPDAEIDGVLVARQVKPVVELLLGVSRDPQFGPVVTLAAGGTLTELLDDAVSRVPPFGPGDAEDMLSQLRVTRLLHGYRGSPPGDVAALVDVVTRVGALALVLPDRLAALDVNPLFVLPAGEGVVAGDALAVLATSPG